MGKLGAFASKRSRKREDHPQDPSPGPPSGAAPDPRRQGEAAPHVSPAQRTARRKRGDRAAGFCVLEAVRHPSHHGSLRKMHPWVAGEKGVRTRTEASCARWYEEGWLYRGHLGTVAMGFPNFNRQPWMSHRACSKGPATGPSARRRPCPPICLDGIGQIDVQVLHGQQEVHR